MPRVKFRIKIRHIRRRIAKRENRLISVKSLQALDLMRKDNTEGSLRVYGTQFVKSKIESLSSPKAFALDFMTFDLTDFIACV